MEEARPARLSRRRRARAGSVGDGPLPSFDAELSLRVDGALRQGAAQPTGHGRNRGCKPARL